jgi:hypothetical protein
MQRPNKDPIKKKFINTNLKKNSQMQNFNKDLTKTNLKTRQIKIDLKKPPTFATCACYH